MRGSFSHNRSTRAMGWNRDPRGRDSCTCEGGKPFRWRARVSLPSSSKGVLIVFGLALSPATWAETPADAGRQEDAHYQDLNENCGTTTLRSDEEVVRLLPNRWMVALQPTYVVSIQKGEVLCLRLGHGPNRVVSEVRLLREERYADLILVFEPAQDGSFGILRALNGSLVHLFLQVDVGSQDERYRAFGSIGPREDAYLMVPETVETILVGDLRWKDSDREVPLYRTETAAPTLGREAYAWNGFGFRLGGTYGHSVRPLAEANRLVKEQGYGGFPSYLPRVGAYLGWQRQRTLMDVSLVGGAAKSPHQDDADLFVRLSELSLLLEMGVVVAGYGGLVIYPTFGFGLGEFFWGQSKENPVEDFGGALPRVRGTTSTSTVLGTLGIGLGQMIVAEEKHGYQEGFSLDLRLGYQQQLYRGNWGYYSLSEEERVTLPGGPRVNMSAFVVTLSVGAARRSAKWKAWR